MRQQLRRKKIQGTSYDKVREEYINDTGQKPAKGTPLLVLCRVGA